MSKPATTETTKHSTRVRIIGAELRLLRTRSDLLGTSDTIHALRNSIATAQGALGLVDKYAQHDRPVDAAALLDLAETRLREVRRMLTIQRSNTMRQGRATHMPS